MNQDILKLFENEGNKAAEKAAAFAIKDNSVLEQVFEGVHSDKKRIKNASSKCLRVISSISPVTLYPKFSFFVNLIESEDNILKWNAIYVLGDLTDVDVNNKFNSRLLEKYFGLLYDKSMITAANTYRILGKVAKNKPGFRKKITDKMLSVNLLPFSTECRNILAGTALEAIDLYFDKIKDKKRILSFARKHSKNTRSGTKRKAENFLKKHK